MEAFKSWEEMSTLEQYACQYWDMYKDAYGCRPRGIDTSAWTEAEFEREFVQLSKTIESNYKDQLAQEEVCGRMIGRPDPQTIREGLQGGPFFRERSDYSELDITRIL